MEARSQTKLFVFRKTIIAGLIVLATIALGTGAYALYMRPIQVAVARPQSGVPIRIFGLGTVEAQVTSKIGFEVAGALVELNADSGDLVKSGRLIARLHDREQAARLAQAQAAVAQAEAVVRQAAAVVERARVDLQQKEQINARRQALVQRGSTSAEVGEEAQATFERARAEFAQARASADVAAETLRQVKAAATFEEARLEKYGLHAPYDAVVVTRHRELGSVLGPGEAVFTLVDSATVWALAYIEEQRAGLVQVGQSAEVVLRSLPFARFKGRVVRIDIESDRVNEERRVYVKCEDCPPDFHLGEQVEVSITAATLDQALVVPRAALVRTDGEMATVWTLEDGRLAQREVSLGARTGDGRVQIVGELPPGAQVIVKTDPGLRVGRSAVVGPDRRG